MSQPRLPKRIHNGGTEVVITWDDEHVVSYPARALRLNCQCAECVDEMSGRPLLDPATVPDDLRAERIELVGSYAVRIAWSDGHDTGIYPYDVLWELGRGA
jgi:DUF971 family protein